MFIEKKERFGGYFVNGHFSILRLIARLRCHAICAPNPIREEINVAALDWTRTKHNHHSVFRLLNQQKLDSIECCYIQQQIEETSE